MSRTIALADRMVPQLRSHTIVGLGIPVSWCHKGCEPSDMDASAKLQLLKQIPYFASLPLGQVRELVARLRERHYQAGDAIFRKGDRCEGLCIVLSGRVRTVTTSVEGREQVLKVFGPGRSAGAVGHTETTDPHDRKIVTARSWTTRI